MLSLCLFIISFMLTRLYPGICVFGSSFLRRFLCRPHPHLRQFGLRSPVCPSPRPLRSLEPRFALRFSVIRVRSGFFISSVPARASYYAYPRPLFFLTPPKIRSTPCLFLSPHVPSSTVDLCQDMPNFLYFCASRMISMCSEPDSRNAKGKNVTKAVYYGYN